MKQYINQYILFSPLLILYFLIVILFNSTTLTDDEPMYLSFAQNLLHGYYSPSYPNINLWVGHGYPFFLALLLLLKIPLVVIKLFNAIFLYFSIILIYKTICIYVKGKNAILFSLLLGLYPPFYIELPKIMTEPISYFLISAISFLACSIFTYPKVRTFKILLLSILMCYLALTKVIFGYVFLAAFILFGIAGIIYKMKKIYISFFIFFLALVFSTPYLIYTYSLTHKVFYWSNAGGDQLYWISNLNEKEFGDWHWFSFKGEQHSNPELIKNHIAFRDYLDNYNSIERDELLKKKAIDNIKSNPGKFFKNWLSGIGRMLYGTPFSYKTQRLEHFYIILPNTFIVVFLILFLIPTIRLIFLRKIPYGIFFLLTIITIYFLSSSFMAGYWRQFNPIVPVICLWFAYIFDKFIIIKFNLRNNA